MDPFKSLDEASLVDALAEYTSKFTKMMAEGGDDTEFSTCKEIIENLLKEIDFRRKHYSSVEPASKEMR